MNNNSFTEKSSARQNEDKRLSPQQQLSAEIFAEKCAKHPTIPIEYIPSVRLTDGSKPGLIQCAYHRLRLDGHMVKLHPKCRRERMYDIETVLNGRTFYILSVPGPLVQNTDQYCYQQKVEKKGAGYICIKSYSEFLMVYETIMDREHKPLSTNLQTV